MDNGDDFASVHSAAVLAVFSLDSVSTPIVDQLLAAGRLPNLAQIQRSGRRVDLTEELPGAAYPTLYTGRRLADHGLHFPLQWSGPHQQTLPADHLLSAELEAHSLFRRLAGHGVRVLVLDPPECSPHSVDHGVLVSGVEFRARVLLHEWSRPETFGRDLRSKWGRPPRADEVFGEPTLRYLLNMRRRLVAGPERLARAAERLVGSSEFDLVWITFAAAHQAGHVLWHPTFLKKNLSAPEEETLRGAVADVYARMDEALGRVMARLPPGTDIMVLNSKGMGPNTSRTELLGGMLDQILKQGRGEGRGPQHNPLWLLRSCVPQSFRAAAAAFLGDRVSYGLAGRLETLGRDWPRTRAFALPCEVHGFVRFNLKGREARGVVSAEAAPALTEEIIQGLASFEDMGGMTDGGPAVSLVETIAQRVGSGEKIDALPDLIVHWSASPSAPVRGVRSPRFGEVLRSGVGTGRAGNHCPGAWVTLVPARSQIAPAIRPPARLEDVAATMCSALGVPHADLPGRPLLSVG